MRPENHLMFFFLEKLTLTEDSVGAKEEIDIIKAINLQLIQWTFQLLITNLRMKWKYSKLSVNERYATFSWNHSRFLAKHKAIWCELRIHEWHQIEGKTVIKLIPILHNLTFDTICGHPKGHRFGSKIDKDWKKKTSTHFSHLVCYKKMKIVKPFVNK